MGTKGLRQRELGMLWMVLRELEPPVGDVMGWDEMEWVEMGWDGIGWDGKGWMEWDGLKWNGLKWDGMGLRVAGSCLCFEIPCQSLKEPHPPELGACHSCAPPWAPSPG